LFLYFLKLNFLKLNFLKLNFLKLNSGISAPGHEISVQHSAGIVTLTPVPGESESAEVSFFYNLFSPKH